MSPHNSLRVPGKAILAILLITILAMILIAWGVRTSSPFSENEMIARFSFQLIVLPIATLAIWAMVRNQDKFLAQLFSRRGLAPKLILTAVAIGAIIRIMWWAAITACASFGILPQSLASPPAALALSFSCPDALLLILAIVNWILIIPVFEEFIHRGLLQSFLAPRGPVIAVTFSAVIFALFHPPNSHILALGFGIVIGTLFWNVKSLWPPIIAHATYDGLQVFDWICLKISWNPDPANIPLLIPGTVASLLVFLCAAALIFLVSNRWVGTCS